MYPEEYNNVICVNDGAFDFSFDDSVNLLYFQDGANVVCAISPTTLRVVSIESQSVTPPPEEHAGTLDDPYTVREALEEAGRHMDTGYDTEFYCRGTVTRQGDRYGGADYGNIRYVYIGDPGTDYQITIYWLNRYKGAPANDNFETQYDIKVGDELLIAGKLFTYVDPNGNAIPEFASGTYCITINGVEQGPSA